MPRLRDCKLWKICKDKACLKELKLAYGKNWNKPNATILWSKEVCYALHDLIKEGLVQKSGGQRGSTEKPRRNRQHLLTKDISFPKEQPVAELGKRNVSSTSKVQRSSSKRCCPARTQQKRKLIE